MWFSIFNTVIKGLNVYVLKDLLKINIFPGRYSFKQRWNNVFSGAQKRKKSYRAGKEGEKWANS